MEVNHSVVARSSRIEGSDGFLEIAIQSPQLRRFVKAVTHEHTCMIHEIQIGVELLCWFSGSLLKKCKCARKIFLTYLKLCPFAPDSCKIVYFEKWSVHGLLKHDARICKVAMSFVESCKIDPKHMIPSQSSRRINRFYSFRKSKYLPAGVPFKDRYALLPFNYIMRILSKENGR